VVLAHLVAGLRIQENPAKLNHLRRIFRHVYSMLVTGGRDVDDDVSVQIALLGLPRGRHLRVCVRIEVVVESLGETMDIFGRPKGARGSGETRIEATGEKSSGRILQGRRKLRDVWRSRSKANSPLMKRRGGKVNLKKLTRFLLAHSEILPRRDGRLIGKT
jgi:hypothetical protein